jgi:hypothetical protein
MTGAAKNTITKLLGDVGDACARYQDAHLRDLPCKTIEADEIWSYCYAKQKNVPGQHKGTFGYGDVWTWTALCADTKLVPSWLVGERTAQDAWTFMVDLSNRVPDRIQLTTDGNTTYLAAVDLAFGRKGIDYAMLQKGPAPLQPCRMQGDAPRRDPGRPRPGEDLDQLRRAAEPHHADGDAPVHAPHQRLLKEGREPGSRGQPPLHALQLRAASPESCESVPAYPGDGSGGCRPRLVDGGDHGPAGGYFSRHSRNSRWVSNRLSIPNSLNRRLI